jgi:hypothetical protein
MSPATCEPRRKFVGKVSRMSCELVEQADTRAHMFPFRLLVTSQLFFFVAYNDFVFTSTFFTLCLQIRCCILALDPTFPALLEQCFRIKHLQVALLPSTYIQTRQIVRDIYDTIITMAPVFDRFRPRDGLCSFADASASPSHALPHPLPPPPLPLKSPSCFASSPGANAFPMPTFVGQHHKSVPLNTCQHTSRSLHARHLARNRVAGSVEAVYRRITLGWPWPEEEPILVESNTAGFPLCLCVLAIRYAHYKFASRAVGATRAHHGLCRHVSPRSSGSRGATLLLPLACIHTHSLSSNARITTRIFRPPSTPAHALTSGASPRFYFYFFYPNSYLDPPSRDLPCY